MTGPVSVPVTISGDGPGEGPPTPPADVPLTFLVAAGVGLVLGGVAVALAADHAVQWPGHPGVVSATHTVMLGFLTIGVLGALHQFGPVVAGRRLRSVAVARMTALLLIPGVWVLASGFAHNPSWMVRAGGTMTFVGVLLAAWNLSGPLATRQADITVWGLRCSVALLVATAAFGIVYAFDRTHGWFPLLQNRVMAHAHLGLLGWLGLTYVAVAEKLWPMFLLAHRPSARSGTVAVACLAAGAPVLTVGLLFSRPLALIGGTIVGIGIAAHLTSLGGVLRHRQRRLGLLHAFVITGALALLTAAVLALVGGLAPLDATDRPRVVAAEIVSLSAWLGLAVVGHAHKIVPFIRWTTLFERGMAQRPDGTPLLFDDLYSGPAAVATYLLCAMGFAAVVVGLLVSSSTIVVAGGLAVSVGGAIAVVNLATGVRRATGGARSAEPVSNPLTRVGSTA